MALDENVYENFVCNLSEKMYEYRKSDFSDIVFLCIGTDRITGDSFGPLVGYKLKKLFKKLENKNNLLIVGDLEKPLSACNVEKEIKYIYKICPNPYIIAIDAAVSQKESIGNIVVSNGGIKVGKGLNKQIKEIGNISIKAVVAKDSKIPQINFSLLQNTSLNLVMNLAEGTANGIYEIIKYN